MSLSAHRFWVHSYFPFRSTTTAPGCVSVRALDDFSIAMNVFVSAIAAHPRPAGDATNEAHFYPIENSAMVLCALLLVAARVGTWPTPKSSGLHYALSFQNPISFHHMTASIVSTMNPMRQGWASAQRLSLPTSGNPVEPGVNAVVVVHNPGRGLVGVVMG